MTRGLFIAIEGGEGAGKTTQARELVNWLRYLRLDAHLTREPGSGVIGRKIREILLDPAHEGLDPRCEALLYAADRAQHVAKEVRPVMSQGAIVVSDRYADSSVAYQGAGRFLGHETIAGLSAWASGGLVPDLTILLDLDPAEGMKRRRGTPDRIEAEALPFHNHVRFAFLDLAQANCHRYLVADASQPAVAVGNEIRGIVAGLVERRIGDLTVLDEPMANSWREPPGDDDVVDLAALQQASAKAAEVMEQCGLPPVLPDTPATRQIDEFLDDPSAGVQRTRPDRPGAGFFEIGAVAPHRYGGPA